MNATQLTGTYDNGFPVSGNKYLWTRKYSGGDSYAEVVTPYAIFNFNDMMDTLDEEDAPVQSIYLIRPDKAPLPCTFHGTWHNWDDPLRMEIRTNRGKVLDAGYGSNH